MTILVLVSMPPEAPGEARIRGEFDLYGATPAILDALPEADVEAVRGDPREIVSVLERLRPSAIFNLCEAPLGRPDREAHLAGAGYMRIDVRLDVAGVPHVIDINPNPHLGPPGGMHGAVVHAGWTWERFVRQQIAWA